MKQEAPSFRGVKEDAMKSWMLLFLLPPQILASEPAQLAPGQWVRATTGAVVEGEGFAMTCQEKASQVNPVPAVSEDKRTKTFVIGGPSVRVARPCTTLEGEVLGVQGDALVLKGTDFQTPDRRPARRAPPGRRPVSRLDEARRGRDWRGRGRRGRRCVGQVPEWWKLPGQPLLRVRRWNQRGDLLLSERLRGCVRRLAPRVGRGSGGCSFGTCAPVRSMGWCAWRERD